MLVFLVFEARLLVNQSMSANGLPPRPSRLRRIGEVVKSSSEIHFETFMALKKCLEFVTVQLSLGIGPQSPVLHGANG